MKHPIACLTLAFVFLAVPAYGQEATGSLDDGPDCETLPPKRGCIEVEEQFFDRDGRRIDRSRAAAPLGTCDDAKDCAKKAKKKCRNGKHGAAVLVEISANDTKCSYKCADGHTGEIICPPHDEVAKEYEVQELPCEIDLEARDGCIEVEEDVTLPGAADDLHYRHLEITHLGRSRLDAALMRARGYDGVIFRSVVPAGTCDDVKDCAKKANKNCRQSGQGKAKKARISMDKKSCSYTCTGGMQGEIVCEE